MALLHERGVALHGHDDSSEYSGWLLPAVNRVLGEAGVKMEQLQLLAVSTGPGSFTGLRVGLTTAKAWAEVYGTPMVGVSRLAAMAQSQRSESAFVAACYDAQRGELFAALYRRASSSFERVGEELVISPDDFVSLVNSEVGHDPVSWISADPELIRNSSTMATRIAAGDQILSAPAELSTAIARLAQQSAANGQFTDPLALDANYVRRSDAEIFWKEPRPVSVDRGADDAVRVSACRPEDLAAVATILRLCPEAAPWSSVSLAEALQDEASRFLVAWCHQRIEGFVTGRQVTDEGEILNLAVHPDARRKGTGHTLVRELLHAFARERVTQVFLEVRQSNSAAISFYRHLGFRQIATRSGYYRNPSEPALVLACPLSSAAGTA